VQGKLKQTKKLQEEMQGLYHKVSIRLKVHVQKKKKSLLQAGEKA